MSRISLWIVLIPGLLLAGSLQQAVAPRLAIGGAHPDFLLVALGVGSIFLERSKSAWLGFACGLIHGGLAGANLTHYVISRTVGGFLVAWSRNTRLQPNLALAFGTGFFLTLISQVLFMFLAPPPNLVSYLGATIGSAVYNGVLLLPVYLLLRHFIRPSNV